MARPPLVLILSLLGLAPLVAQAVPARVLVFSRTAGFRHGSIPDGIAALRQLALERGWTLRATEDASEFTPASLGSYDAVVFLMTTGDVLDPAQQAAFEGFVRAGHGFVGIHAAADTEYDWPWYGGLVGAYFQSHPAVQPATILVTDRDHPATSFLPGRWERSDEWYDFRHNPRAEVHVLAAVDERTYSGGNMGHDHPIAWCHTYDGGRAWYTALGHTAASYAEPLFLAHLAGGIEFAAGAVPGDCRAGVGGLFEPSGTGSRSPLRMVKAASGSATIVVEEVWAASGYVVYENGVGTWYGTPARTCLAAWDDRGADVALQHRPGPGNRWLVVAAADADGESSCGRDDGGQELNRRPGWPPSAPCP